MIEINSMPFDSKLVGNEYDRAINAKEFARYISSFISNGIIVANGDILENELKVTNAGGTEVNINTGIIHINGRVGWNDSNLGILTLDPGGTQPRIDRIVAEMNATEDVRSIVLKVSKGTENANPQPPTLIRTEEVYQMSLAQCKVNAGQSVIALITDEREDISLCGVARTLSKIRNWGDLKGLS